MPDYLISDTTLSQMATAARTLSGTTEPIAAGDIPSALSYGIAQQAATTLDVYSVEETVVGQWIDGKPIYRATLVGVAPSSETILTDTGIYDEIIEQKGWLVSGTRAGVTLPQALNSTYRLEILLNDTGNLRLISCSNYSGRVYHYVIEYTKTTDAATIEIPNATAVAAAYEEGVQSA